MQKINFQNLPNTTTPINATNLNAIQTNVENVFNGSAIAGNMVVTGIRTKNMWKPELGNSVKSNISSLKIDGDTYTMIASGTSIYFGQVSQTGNAYEETRGILYKVKPNTTYSVSVSNSIFKDNYVTSYNSSKISLGYSHHLDNVFSFTTASNCEYIVVRIGSSQATSGTTYTTTIQLEEGSPTSYTPFQNLNPFVIDNGSNTNGSYIKYPDGTLFCYVNKSMGQTAGTSVLTTSGNVYFSQGVWVFPHAFVSPPIVTIGCLDLAAGVYGACIENPTATQVNCFCYGASSGVNTGIMAMAIGRWK